MTTSRAGSASASDGEVVDTQHKANNVDRSSELRINDSNRVFGLDGASDRYDRKYRPLSRSPSPYRRKRTRSPSPYRNRRAHDRSPSPYRNRGRSDRGYDGNESRSNPKRRTSPPRNNRADKRPYTDRSRNDQRSRSQTNDSRGGPARAGIEREREHVAKPISYAELEKPNAVPNFHNGLPLIRQPQLSSNSGQRHRGDAKGTSNGTKWVKESAESQKPQGTEQKDVKMTNVTEEPEYVPVVEEEKVPTEESREEKRRRWAAKRAAAEQKSKESLLQKAVLTNASEAATPTTASPGPFAESSMSPFPSPRIGDLDSVPASPDVMVIDKQGGFSEGNSPAADSPSAADYDPMQDMLDDRDRAAKKHQNAELPSNAYSETDPKGLSTLPADKVAPVKKQKKELDMFASDDEDEDAENAVEQDDEAKGTVLDEKLLDNWDDPEGYYKLISNELINNGRYRVVRGLGRGVFANVAQAVDVNVPPSDPSQLVAIKMIRRNELMRKASQKEMDFLRKVNEADPQDKRHIIRLLGSFDHKGHLCIVFEHMSKNLRDLLKEETNGHGLTLPAVRIYAKQMFSGLLHLQNCQVIHLDLKPDNVLVSADKKTVKLADFGTAVDKRDIIERTEYLVSRFYRAPEIILGMDISYPVDMWSTASTIYELWTGKIAFTGRSNNQMVKAFIECIGWPSEKLLRKGLANNILEHFELGSTLKFVSREVDQNNKLFVRKIEQQKKINRDLKTRVLDAAKGISSGGPSASELNDFTDLLVNCLHMNVEKRATPKEALAHRFFASKSLAPKSAVVKPQLLKRGTPGSTPSHR